MIRLLTCLLTFLLSMTLTQAATLTVAPSDDLLGAIQRLGPGDTLLLSAGTYTPGELRNLPGGTSWQAPVTIKAAPGATAVLLASPGAMVAYLALPSEQYIIFENLIFDGNNRQGSTVAVTGWPGPWGAHHIRFVNCEFRNAHGEISLSHTHHNEWIGGSIHDNGDTTGLRHGIYLSSESSDNLIDGMQIYNNQGYGIHMYNGQASGSDRNRIRNNTLHNNALCCKQDHVLISGTDSSEVSQNMVCGGGGGGINVGYAGGASNVQVADNTVIGTPGDRPGIWLQGSGHSVRGNTSCDNGGGNVVGAPEAMVAPASGVCPPCRLTSVRPPPLKPTPHNVRVSRP